MPQGTRPAANLTMGPLRGRSSPLVEFGSTQNAAHKTGHFRSRAAAQGQALGSPGLTRKGRASRAAGRSSTGKPHGRGRRQVARAAGV
jgi:hypothetical protein